MSTTIVTPYSFDAHARTVTLTGLTTVEKSRIVSIYDQTVRSLLYAGGTDAQQSTLVGKVLTLPYGNIPTYARNSDVLHIVYDTTPAAGGVSADTVTALVGGAPSNLDTLGEIATALDGKQPLDSDLTALAALTAPATKLSGIATGATANSPDATLLARANHTGTQTASTVSDFSTAADARIAAASLYRPGGTDVAITDGGTGVSSLPTGLLVGAGTGAITAATMAGLNTVGIGQAVFIAHGGTIPVGTPTYTIVIELA